jgi:pectinesterase
MMKGITVRNTAGAKMFQAVALRVSADRTAFFQCSFEAFQDTLYANAFRQYYSECMILGTVDFIFGNAAAVFQNCDILAQTGIVGQQNTYTAQGRTSPVTNTGISFQNCYFDGTQALHAQSTIFLTYLGRPWKEYAVCVHLKSNLGTVVNPAGWLYWNFTNFGLHTSFFAEYHSIGPGAKGPRVSWSHQITNPAIADRYQANAFIQGNKWVPATGFPYTAIL